MIPMRMDYQVRNFALVTAVLLMTASVSFAQIYAYRDSKGRIHITNIPLADAKTVPLQPLEALGKKTATSAKESSYTKYIYHYGKKYSVDPDLIRAIIKAESNFNRWAVSKKGARGLMQMIPATAKLMGVRNVFNPAENIEGGTKYFRQMLDRFNNNTYLALAAYNAGPEAVVKYNGIPRYRETQNYVRIVMGHYKAYKGTTAMLPKTMNENRVVTYRDSDGKIHLTNVNPDLTAKD